MPETSHPIEAGSFRVSESISFPEAVESVKKEESFQQSAQITEQGPPEEQASSPTAVAPAVQAPPAIVAITKTPLRRDIEKILEEDLRSLYIELLPPQKIMFRQQGELTASRIEYVLIHAKATITYIVFLIRRWLMYLTGVNRYFLEQEAKIKAEKILFLNTKE